MTRPSRRVSPDTLEGYLLRKARRLVLAACVDLENGFVSENVFSSEKWEVSLDIRFVKCPMNMQKNEHIGRQIVDSGVTILSWSFV